MTTLSTTLRRPLVDSTSDEIRAALSWWLCVGAIVLAALLMRSIGINRHSFWYDEAVTAELIRAPWLDLLFGRVRDNGNPPLFWLLAKAWSSFFGDGEVALRSLSVISSIVAIPLFAALGQRLFSRVTGLTAAALLAVSPLSLELANEARAYALLQLLTIASTLMLVRWLDRKRGVELFVYCLTVFAACLSHYYAIFVLVAHGMYLLATREGRRMIVPWFEAMVVTAIAGSSFWFSAFWSQIHTPDNLSRMGTRWPMQFLATPLVMAAGRTLVWRDANRAMLVVATAGAVTFFWVPGLVALVRMRHDPRGFVLLLAMLSLPIAMPLLAALLGSPMYHVRAGSIVLPAILLLVANGLTIVPRFPRTIAMTGIAMMTGFSIANYWSRPLKDDWRSAAPVLLPHLQAREAVVFDTSIEVTSFAYYARRSGIDNFVDVLGITQPPDPATGSLLGVRFESLKQAEYQPRDYASGVFDQPRVTVALCVPLGSVELYQQMFAQHGFRLVSQEHFHRIDVLHFSRSPLNVAANP